MLGVIQTSSRTLSGLPDMIQTYAGLALQANYGHRVTNSRGAALYVEVHFLANGLRSVQSTFGSAPHDYATLFVAPGLRVKFLPKAKVSPYLAMGGGYAAYQQSKLPLAGGYVAYQQSILLPARTPDSLSRTVSRGAFDYGGVVDIPVWRWLGLRGEIRDFYTGNPNLNVRLAASGQHNLVAGGGFVLDFGKK